MTKYEDSSHREAPNKHERGSRAYQEMVAKDTKRLDDHANLPFQFVKPPKRTHARRDLIHCCSHCGAYKHVNKHTVGIQCPSCSKYSSVTKDNTFTKKELLERTED